MGFSADWLALREPADHRARNTPLLEKAALVAGKSPVIMDLGSGTGSTLRAMTPFVAADAQWRLVDKDQALLELAANNHPEGVSVHPLDLQEISKLPVDGVTMVTASALLDLVSANWLEMLLSELSVPVYFALTYDGQMLWNPTDENDQSVIDSFNKHQLGDKGMGPALGGGASDFVLELMNSLGYQVHQADSPWRLDSKQKDLQSALLTGIAGAAIEMGNLRAEQWLSSKLAQVDSLESRVGHIDILGIPPNARGTDAVG